MTPDDLELRHATYRLFVDLGRAPAVAEVAGAVGGDVAGVLAGWRRLHDAHALVLDRSGAAILMANPFSAVPTRHRVRAGGREWFANCAWDAFGICAALHVDGEVHTSCPDCDESLRDAVRDRAADREDLVFHCPVPARLWWDDIVFT